MIERVPLKDTRVDFFCYDWFENKTVLDIGCNAGIFTISLALHFNIKRVIGVDIDPHLIRAARKNVALFVERQTKVSTIEVWIVSMDFFSQVYSKFPPSFPLNFGPLIMPPISAKASYFPNNIHFFVANYVLDSDEKLDKVSRKSVAIPISVCLFVCRSKRNTKLYWRWVSSNGCIWIGATLVWNDFFNAFFGIFHPQTDVSFWNCRTFRRIIAKRLTWRTRCGLISRIWIFFRTILSRICDRTRLASRITNIWTFRCWPLHWVNEKIICEIIISIIFLQDFRVNCTYFTKAVSCIMTRRKSHNNSSQQHRRRSKHCVERNSVVFVKFCKH